MSKLETALDAVCGTGVLLLTPIWIVYKLAVYALS